jgi:hypothetical protein
MEEFIRKRLTIKPLSAKQEYKMLPKEEKEIVDEFITIIRKHKKGIGSLRMAECLKRALDIC